MRLGFILLLTFGARLCFSQSGAIDAISNELKNHSEEDTIRVNLLNKLSYHYRWIDFITSQQYAEQSSKLARRLYFQKGIAMADNRMAHCYWALGDNDLAIEKGLEAVAIAEVGQFTAVLGESFQILSRAYLDQKELEKAEFYIRKSENIAERTKNWDLLSRVYNLRGVIQFVKNNRDSALLLYKKALTIVSEHPTSKSNLSQITSNIGECYADSNPVLGLHYFKEALAIAKAEETRNRSAEAGILSVMGHAFIKKGNYAEAERYLQQSLRLSRELGLKRSTRHVYAGLVNLKIRQGNASEALAYLKQYYSVHDSLLNVAKTRQIVELETKYELEKKELAIQLLGRDNKIQVLWTNILFMIIALIGIGSIVIFYLLLYRENNNRKILNLQIDNLTAQHKALSEKYRDALTAASPVPIESTDQRLLRKAVEVVESNIADPLFGVEQMAKELGMSRTNLHRKMKAITGFPPSELIRNIRLRKAATLLVNQADSIAQIGFMVGFEDNSYFSKSFKKQFGVTPSEYGQSIRRSDQLLRLEV